MLTSFGRRGFGRLLFAGLAVAAIHPAHAAEQGVKLYSLVSGPESIVVALTKEDAGLGDDAESISKALRERGSLTVWRYVVRKAKDGELEQAPWKKVSVQAQAILRVEPYRTPLRVIPVE